MEKVCRICATSSRLELILDLGNQPWGNGFLTKEQIPFEKKYPLRTVQCSSCRAVQLDYTVPKETMFMNHTYLSGTTKSLRQHFQRLAEHLNKKIHNLGLPKNVLDIGSNDGTQLIEYKKLGFTTLGVESSENIAKIANDKNRITTLPNFFNENIAKNNIRTTFSVINASGVFFHLEELHSVCRGVKFLLHSDGIFVIQFIYLKEMVENLAFDQIYHEHLLYYTIESLSYLLNLHDLEIFDASKSKIHGGSLIAFVSHKGRYDKSKILSQIIKEERKSRVNEKCRLNRFSTQINDLKNKQKRIIQNWVEESKIIYGLGAPVKGNTLLNYYDLSPREIGCLVERNPLRDKLYSPGCHIPVVLDTEVKRKPDVYFVLAWNFKQEILNRHAEDIERGVDFFFPIDVAE